ncbi:ribbon-helix-helix domain-containing protein [Paludisphaera rhizosphaerae]|uniref:ribbon-helix-helix domain-containing protein n=1 Tax=Paludisphaera rhizosphaerae TaxID=2711216 RepID=UPI0013EC569A|nr:type II toxin-antitoxin system ParD family antitoxin [Paludisphaera rhizosphaerae]
MTTMNLSLPDEMMAFIEAQAALGGHASAAEYVQALIREAQKRTAKQELEAKLREGMESGPATEMTPRTGMGWNARSGNVAGSVTQSLHRR